MVMTGDISNKFRNLGLVSACLVVFIHLGNTDHCMGSALWFSRIMMESLCQMAVPFFFFASGYFLSKHTGAQNWYETEVCKRVRSLLLPYLFWCAFYVAFSNALQFVANIVAHRSLFENVFVMSDWVTWFGLDMQKTPYFTPMWYLRSLLILILASPLFILSKKRMPVPIFLILAFIVELYYFRGAFYFAAGMLFNGREDIVGWRMGVMAGLFALLALVIKLMMLGAGALWPVWGQQLLVIALLTFAWSVIPTSSWLPVLTRNAFPCYILHWPVLCIYTIFVSNSFSMSSAVGMILKGFAGISGAFLIAIAFRRLMPRLSGFVFGGR